MSEEESTEPIEESHDESVGGNLESLGDINVEVTAVLGSISMPIEQFLKLGRGAIVELDRGKEEDVDVLVNGHMIGRGEIMVVDETVGISITSFINKSKDTFKILDDVE